ncbi:DUF2608 domain-containing protein [Legionella geestiana]|nr:DUF2608 domain-containing protein [Legionella geestiana]
MVRRKSSIIPFGVFMRVALFFLCSLFLNVASARVVNYQTNNFKDIAQKYASLHVPMSRTLMVFDLDDTLMTMSRPLGSVGWWDWQSGLLKNPEIKGPRFATSMEHLSRVQKVLFERVPMELTDKDALPFLQQAAARGATLLGLTARGSELQHVTFTQLRDNGFIAKDASLFRQNGLRIHHKTHVKGAFSCPAFKQAPAYHQGVLFLSGGDKGQALLCALSQSDRSYKAILFVDDSRFNNRAIAKVFAESRDILVLNVNFTREHAKALDARTNPDTQKHMLAEWKRLKKSLAAA